MYRTLKSALETSYGTKIEDHPALTWLPRHAANNIFRFAKGSDGRTAYYRLKGREFDRKIPQFGECVWYIRAKSKGKFKGSTRFDEGIWVGVREESGEHLILTSKGAVKCRTVRRKDDREAWQLEKFNECVGTPWEPVPGQPNAEIRIRVEDGMRHIPVEPKEPEAPVNARSFRIERADILPPLGHGPTPGCRGCRAVLAEKEWLPQHAEKCRERFEKIFIENGDPRILRHFERVTSAVHPRDCLLYTSPSPRDVEESRMPSSA